MKGVLGIIFTAVASVAMLSGVRASASVAYPTTPTGTSVTLDLIDFIQAVPRESPGLPNPNLVIGDTLGQHPGAFGIGFPLAGLFFDGVFGSSIDLSPGTNVYLWEVEYVDPMAVLPFPGPLVQLGYWNGSTFQPHGNQVQAWYGLTDKRWLGDPQCGLPFTGCRPILSSTIPLSSFIPPGFSYELNAVEVTTVPGHIMVNAVAVDTLPEACTMLLVGGGLMGLLAHRRKRPWLGT